MEMLLPVLLGIVGLAMEWLDCVERDPNSRFPPGKRLTPTGKIVGLIVIILSGASSYSIYRANMEAERFKSQSERVVFEQYIEVPGRGRQWDGPNRIPSGAVVELRGFRKEMLLEFSGNEVKLAPSEKSAQSVKIAGPTTYIGSDPHSATPLKWGIASAEGFADSGWVTVRSTVDMAPP